MFGDTSHNWKLGDEVWIFLGNHQGERTKGTIVHKFTPEGWSFAQYVIEIPTHIDPLLEVRSSFLMYPTQSPGFEKPSENMIEECRREMAEWKKEIIDITKDIPNYTYFSQWVSLSSKLESMVESWNSIEDKADEYDLDYANYI